MIDKVQVMVDTIRRDICKLILAKSNGKVYNEISIQNEII